MICLTKVMKDTSADDKSPTTNNTDLETSPSRVNNKDNPSEVTAAEQHVVVKKGRKRLKSEDYSNSNPLQENGGGLVSEVRAVFCFVFGCLLIRTMQ